MSQCPQSPKPTLGHHGAGRGLLPGAGLRAHRPAQRGTPTPSALPPLPLPPSPPPSSLRTACPRAAPLSATTRRRAGASRGTGPPAGAESRSDPVRHRGPQPRMGTRAGRRGREGLAHRAPGRQGPSPPGLAHSCSRTGPRSPGGHCGQKAPQGNKGQTWLGSHNSDVGVILFL